MRLHCKMCLASSLCVFTHVCSPSCRCRSCYICGQKEKLCNLKKHGKLFGLVLFQHLGGWYMSKYHPYKRQGSSVSQQCNNMINVIHSMCTSRISKHTACPYFTERRALIQSCKGCTYVFHCLWLTFLHCTIAPLWYRCARAEALGAAWLSFYQILGPFKWMIPLLHRDHQTKSPLFLFSPLLCSCSSSLILLWKHSCSYLLPH